MTKVQFLPVSSIAKSFDLDTPEVKTILPDNEEYEEIIRYLKPRIDKSNLKLREAQKEEEHKSVGVAFFFGGRAI